MNSEPSTKPRTYLTPPERREARQNWVRCNREHAERMEAMRCAPVTAEEMLAVWEEWRLRLGIKDATPRTENQRARIDAMRRQLFVYYLEDEGFEQEHISLWEAAAQ